MKTIFLVVSVLLNVNAKDSNMCFRYISAQDTIIVKQSDIVKIDSTFFRGWSFFVNDSVANQLLSIKDLSGTLYYFCEYQKCWIPLSQLEWTASALPRGWYVSLNESGSFLFDNNIIQLRYGLYDRKCLCKHKLSRESLKEIRKISKKGPPIFWRLKKQ